MKQVCKLILTFDWIVGYQDITAPLSGISYPHIELSQGWMRGELEHFYFNPPSVRSVIFLIS